MRGYLNKTLHMDVQIKRDISIYDKLPLLYKGSYDIYRVTTNGVEWLAIEPKMDLGLSQLRKNRAFVENALQINVAIFLKKATFYSKEKMVEEGIPFVIKDSMVYLPFIGMLLGEKQRTIKPVHKISFLTQRLLLTGIYEGYNSATVTQLAEKMGVSKMAISKSFDEIEYLDISVMEKQKKRRSITMNDRDKECWERIRPFLRDPVINRFEFEDDIGLSEKAGISALCEYSMLSDNEHPTYALIKGQIGASGIKDRRQLIKGEEVGCVVLELGYFMDPVKKNVQDPLSVLLTLENDMEDERVELSMENMLREYVWLQD